MATCMAQKEAHSILFDTAQHAALVTKVHTAAGLIECMQVRSSNALKLFSVVPAAIENLSNLTCLEALNVRHCPHVTASAFQHLKTTRLKSLSFSDSVVVGPRSLMVGVQPHKHLTSLVLVESK